MTIWRVIQCTSGAEDKAIEKLDALGYPGAWYPKEEVNARPRGKAAREEAKGKPRKVSRPYVSGYVFLPANQIDVQEITGHYGKLYLRVMAFDGEPWAISDEEMARMKDMPEQLRCMVEDIERKEREAREAKRPVVGQKARVIEGPFADNEGYVVDLSPKGYAVDIGPVRVWVDVDKLERVAE